VRRKLKNLKNKSGHSDNGSPRAVVDLATYREHHHNHNGTGLPPHWDSAYSGWSNASRPRDCPIFLRYIAPAVFPPPPPP
jgi:hypothetical protein